MEIAFTIQQTPKGDWRLIENVTPDDGQSNPFPLDRGLYESPAKAEAAMKIILSPTILNYDPNGDQIK